MSSDTAPATPAPPRQASFQEIMEKSAKSALHGGVAGAAAMGANVAALMWIRTTVRLYRTALLKEKEEKGSGFVLSLAGSCLVAYVVERTILTSLPLFCIRHSITLFPYYIAYIGQLSIPQRHNISASLADDLCGWWYSSFLSRCFTRVGTRPVESVW
jgi:hypothetical protein